MDGDAPRIRMSHSVDLNKLQEQPPGGCMEAFFSVSTWLGASVIIYLGIKFALASIKGFTLYVWSQWECSQLDLVGHYGSWAVITGATDGIGLSMARQLASRGMSIVLVSRSEKKLAATRAELELIPGAGKIETIRIDLSESSLDNFASIRAQLDPDNRDIGILVNNAGVYADSCKRLNNFPMEHLLAMANLNMINPVHMTHMIMPGMIQRGKGLVVNVSSIMGSVTAPLVSIYAPSKHFLNAFTRQLQAEYADHPVDIVLLTPGPILTKHLDGLSRLNKPSCFSPEPDAFARTAINALSARYDSFAGTIAHGLIMYGNALLEGSHLFERLFPPYLRSVVKEFRSSPVARRRRTNLIQR